MYMTNLMTDIIKREPQTTPRAGIMCESYIWKNATESFPCHDFNGHFHYWSLALYSFPVVKLSPLALFSTDRNIMCKSAYASSRNSSIQLPTSLSSNNSKGNNFSLDRHDGGDEAFFLVAPQDLSRLHNNDVDNNRYKSPQLKPRPCPLLMEEANYYEPTHFDATIPPSNTHHDSHTPKLFARTSSSRPVSLFDDENYESDCNSAADRMDCGDDVDHFDHSSSRLLLTPPIRTGPTPLNLEPSFLR